MKYVNIVFEDDINDSDLILVPDYVASDLVKYSQAFFDWLSDSPKKMFGSVSYIECETEDFLYWLNHYVIKPDEEKAKVVLQHVRYNPLYKSLEF